MNTRRGEPFCGDDETIYLPWSRLIARHLSVFGGSSASGHAPAARSTMLNRSSKRRWRKEDQLWLCGDICSMVRRSNPTDLSGHYRNVVRETYSPSRGLYFNPARIGMTRITRKFAHGWSSAQPRKLYVIVGCPTARYLIHTTLARVVLFLNNREGYFAENRAN